MKKLVAKGQMSEVKTVLGWTINTRSLLLQLPFDKHKKWTKDITSILGQTKIKNKQLETLVGRLEHIATVIPML
jgi:hypothetical protein